MDRLRTRDLTKVYDRTAVVDRISLEFAAGTVTALLGRNGAGKTTTFLMMAGIVRPDGGTVELNGESVDGIPSYVLVDRDGNSKLRNDLRNHDKLKKTLKKMIE